MSFLSNMKGWQKGAIFGFVFTFVISLIATMVLIYIDIRLESQGAPHMCFAFTESVFCTLDQAIETRIAFFFVMLVAFGIPVSATAAFIGYLTDRTGIR